MTNQLSLYKITSIYLLKRTNAVQWEINILHEAGKLWKFYCDEYHIWSIDQYQSIEINWKMLTVPISNSSPYAKIMSHSDVSNNSIGKKLSVSATGKY